MTTCTPSRAPRTRTPGRCWRSGRTAAARPRCSAGSRGRPRSTQLVASGWAAPLTAGRDTVRRWAPQDRRGRRRRGAGPGRGGALGPDAQPGAAHRARRRWPAGRCCSRCPAAATSGRHRLRGAAARGRAVPGAAGRCPCRRRGRRRGAAGAARTRTRAAAAAGRRACARWSSGPGAPPRNWAAPSPATAVRTSGGAEVIAEVGGDARGHRGHAGSRAARRRRLRGRRAARRLGAARPGQPARVRGSAAALAQRGRAGAARRPRAARSSSWPTPRSRRCRRWCAGTR